LDWDRLGRPYLRELLTVLEGRGYRGIAEHFTVDHLDTPATPPSYPPPPVGVTRAGPPRGATPSCTSNSPKPPPIWAPR
ncbi:hypothetical protein, partial [Nocardia farcinica]|uniref:hypothetical protein n=1 Tax=Nocardia farcinica TaxID=37329 RepID=UPI002456296F